jgi:hypothetical protein
VFTCLSQTTPLFISYIFRFYFMLKHRIVSLPGPEAYTSDATQPAGLLCNPESLPPNFFDVPSYAARRPYFHTTRETLVAKGGTSWARIVR